MEFLNKVYSFFGSITFQVGIFIQTDTYHRKEVDNTVSIDMYALTGIG
jgi:hypothetical protein